MSLVSRAFGSHGVLAVVIGLLGCFPQHDSRQRLLDAARDLNVAARFGRMDVAAEHTSPATRAQFLQRHKGWGKTVRIVDVALDGVDLGPNDTAQVQVTVLWTHIDEGALRTTTLHQTWQNQTKAGWQLEREQRHDGDRGLIGEVSAIKPSEARRPDVHFETKVLGRSGPQR